MTIQPLYRLTCPLRYRSLGVALHFRSDRVRFLRGRNPALVHCKLWPGWEKHGRHFTRRDCFPDALFDSRLTGETACEAEVPEDKIKATLTFDALR